MTGRLASLEHTNPARLTQPLRDENPTSSLRNLSIRRALVVAALLLATIGAFTLPSAYRDYRAIQGLTPGEISAVVVHPNGDWPVVTLDATEEIAAFVDWLATTRDTTRLRSAPPPIVFDGEIRFRDGSTERFRTSAVMEAIAETDGMDGDTKRKLNLHDPRGDVLIDLPDRSLTRSGERRPLADLVDRAR